VSDPAAGTAAPPVPVAPGEGLAGGSRRTRPDGGQRSDLHRHDERAAAKIHELVAEQALPEGGLR